MGGSFTQWIFDHDSCNCGNQPVADNEIRSSRLFCRTCQGSVETGRHGSLTQWIFTSGTVCKCATPNLGVLEQQKKLSVAPTFQSVPEPEQELALDENARRNFPTDRYTPLRELGRGANSTVYLCRDKLLRKRVAVKILKNLTDRQLVAFQNEARATSTLNHPVILTVLDFGPTEGGTPFMVQEYFAGITLQDYLRQFGPLTSEQFGWVFDHLTQALQHAHSKGVMHRDIKPSNIIVNPEQLRSPRLDEQRSSPPLRLIDFGLARLRPETIGENDERSKQSATIVGTPAYMAPDAVRSGTYDQRSEVYSLGCVMFESLTGRQLFQAETALELIHMHASVEPPSVSEATGQAFSADLQKLLAKCLEKDPDNRLSDMQEVAAKLAKLLPEDFSDSATTPTGAQHQSHIAPGRRIRIVAAAIIFGALSLLGAICYRYLGMDSSTKPARSEENRAKFEHVRQDEELKVLNTAEPNFPKHSEKERKNIEIAYNVAQANRYFHGSGVRQDYHQAFNLFLDAARAGNADAQESVGYMLERGLGVAANPAEALNWYSKSAKQGNPAAQLNLGTLYLEARGTAANYAEAMRWFKLAAKKGNARSKNNIAYMYENGLGVQRDYTEARKLYAEAAASGEPMSYVNLGYLYESGLGGPRDYRKALNCYRLAAKSDIAAGLRRLGRLILVGHGTDIDYDEAYRLFSRAAKKGDATAMRWLGFMTLNGQAVKANPEQAFYWYRQAAELNDAESQCKLGQMYETGRGTGKDLKKARYWYGEAAARGEQEARAALDALSKK
jgi:TPR repeat protein/serine/threonine protein kinase